MRCTHDRLFTYLLGIWGAALEILLVGVVIIPAYTRALQKILPGWRFRLRDLVSFDAEDRELYRKIRDRILAKKRLVGCILILLASGMSSTAYLVDLGWEN